LIDACPTACRITFHNPALAGGITIHIPADEPTPTTVGSMLPTAAAAEVPAPPHR
jgi:hypothetical protein